MKKQRGFSMIGYIVVLGLCAFLALKLFPPYTEYFMIQKIFKKLVVNPGLQDGKVLKSAFQRYADMDNITGINADDLEISKTAISARYSVRVPLFANINLLLEFSPSSGVD